MKMSQQVETSFLLSQTLFFFDCQQQTVALKSDQCLDQPKKNVNMLLSHQQIFVPTHFQAKKVVQCFSSLSLLNQ